MAKMLMVKTRPLLPFFFFTFTGKGWFVYLRLYGPETPYFEKEWIPGDAEKIR